MGTEDTELTQVSSAFISMDRNGSRFGRVLRATIDQLLDGQHTGRYRWEDLHKTEKTHAGTLVEINLQREFHLQDGTSMDYRIGGIDVDCKFSQALGGWEIPPEAWRGEHVCLVVWAVDRSSSWGAGLIRASDQYLGRPNRDLKRQLTAAGRARIRWIWNANMTLPANVLLHLDPETLQMIFEPTSGAERTRRLFRLVQGQLIGRVAVATVAQQEDYMKRVRGNRGARDLMNEGIVILGQYEYHRRVAGALRLPVPSRGESLSVRLVAVHEDDLRPKVWIEDRLWSVARNDEPAQPAPIIPISGGFGAREREAPGV